MTKDEKFDTYLKQLESSIDVKDTLMKINPSIDSMIEAENHKEEIREQRNKLKLVKNTFNLLKILIILQVIMFDLIIVFIICLFSQNFKFFSTLKQEMIIACLNFLKYFIGAIIVQLFGMLILISRFTFKKI